MLTGHLDDVGVDRISGWARDGSAPERRIGLALFDGDQQIATFVADKMRTDLAKAGLGDGRYGFWIQLPAGLFAMPVHRISVRYVETGGEIGGSPKLLYRPGGQFDEAFGAWVEDQVGAAIAAADRPELLEPLLGLSTNLLARVLGGIDRFNSPNKSTAIRHIDLSSLPELLRRSAEQAAGGLKPVHVPIRPEPQLSIVIASAGRPADDVALVRSIVPAGKGIAYEVLLIDNSGAVETAVLPLLVRGGARVLRIHSPPGVLAAYAEGARLARGRTLLFLTDLRELGPDALAVLLDTLDREGEGSLVAPRLIAGDRVAAAGLAVDPLGNRSATGQGSHRANLRFQVLREADDLPLNALMMSRSLVDALGGLSHAARFQDYASTHLALSAKERGGRVLVQGGCEAVLAGESGGVSTRGRGRAAFLARWNGALPRIGTPVEPVGARVALMVDEQFPNPDEDAASWAILSHARALQRLGYLVEFVAMQPGEDRLARARALRARGVAAHEDVGNPDQFLASRAGQFDIVYAHRFHVARHVLKPARAANPGACLVFSVADLHHLREARRREVTGRPDPVDIEAIRDEELACIGQADVVLTHSTVERDLIRAAVPAARVAVALWAVPVAGEPSVLAGRSGLCFLGSYRHQPNVDAVAHFCREVWPLLGAPVRAAGFDVVGAHSNLLKGVELPGDVRVVGFVKAVGDYLKGKRVMVAPLRYGAGVKGKVLMSLALGLPCVMTPVAAEGIALPQGLADALVAQDDAAFAARIEALSADDALWQRVTSEAVAWAAGCLSEAAIDAALAAAVDGHPSRAGGDRLAAG
jgi:glycosyltransferase involved in cell wall biosynthesis/GT2 family glycosyltransferase